ncbi:MAG: isocitrate lyase/phosphoenolpyruvate mutase family protein [Actinomycetes bacterium]
MGAEVVFPIVVNQRRGMQHRGHRLRHVGTPKEQRKATTTRGRLYLEAGADCIYPTAVSDERLIVELVEEIGGPVNILLLRPGAPDLATRQNLGASQISLGGGLFTLAQKRVRDAAEASRAGDLACLWPPVSHSTRSSGARLSYSDAGSGRSARHGN